MNEVKMNQESLNDIIFEIIDPYNTIEKVNEKFLENYEISYSMNNKKEIDIYAFIPEDPDIQDFTNVEDDLDANEIFQLLEEERKKTEVKIKISDLVVTTQSAKATMSYPIDLKILSEVIAEEISKNKNKYFPIRGVLYKTIHTGEISKPKENKNGQFPNNCSILIKSPMQTGRYINVKVFRTGKITMTGCLVKEDGISSMKILEQFLKKKKHLFKKKLIKNFIEENKYFIKSYEVEKCFSQSEKYEEYDLKTFLEENKDLFKEKELRNYLEKNKDLFKEGNQKDFSIHSFETTMVNSGYSLGFSVDRERFYNFLCEYTELNVSFTPITYAGVKISFYYNSINKNQDGICRCPDSFCTGDKVKAGKGSGEKINQCKKVTISVFESGNVIDTGGRNIKHARAAYDYINKIIRENAQEFVKINLKDVYPR
jgi:TATA-box binding protein (TBP) (component of TFIID and TFIIIB)